MNHEIQALRDELDAFRAATQHVLALTLTTIAEQSDAKPLLRSFVRNLRAAAATQHQATDSFANMAAAVLMPLSSVALKQYPHDPEVQACYRDLRPGERH